MRHGFKAKGAHFPGRGQSRLEGFTGKKGYGYGCIRWEFRCRLVQALDILRGDLDGKSFGYIFRIAIPIWMNLCVLR